MALDQFLALCERTGILDCLRSVVDAVDQLPATVVLASHPQRLELCGCVLQGPALPGRTALGRPRTAAAGPPADGVCEPDHAAHDRFAARSDQVHGMDGLSGSDGRVPEDRAHKDTAAVSELRRGTAIARGCRSA